MENQLQVFESEEFGEVRIVMEDKEPWFVGKDVAKILGYSNQRDALSKHVDAEDKRGSQIATPSGKQEMTVISESGLYSLVFSSKLPAAKKFKHWVTSEVLPSIRKTGAYAVPKLAPHPAYRSRMVGTAIRDIGSTAKALQSVFKVAEGMALAKATAMIEQVYGIDMDPVREHFPAAEHETGYMTPTALGMKLGGVKPKEVNKLLAELGFQHKEGKDWRLNENGRGYAEEKPYTAKHGHSGWQIMWNDEVIPVLQEAREKAGAGHE